MTQTYSHHTLTQIHCSLYHIMNTELTHITDWFRENKLSLNVSKTNHMLFLPTTPSHSNDIKIDNNAIAQVHITKFLGITIDDELTWNHHIINIQARIQDFFSGGTQNK